MNPMNERKMITIQPKRFAMELLNSNPSLKKVRYDSGRYKWYGSESEYVGREVSVPEHVKALWVERRQDKDGPYASVFCVGLKPLRNSTRL